MGIYPSLLVSGHRVLECWNVHNLDVIIMETEIHSRKLTVASVGVDGECFVRAR